MKLAVVAALCLCASAPPGWFPGAGLLVIPGWMAFYALISDPARSRVKRTAYLIGLAHLLSFSFSLRHILLPAYIAIGFVGGLYYVMHAWWTRGLLRYVPGGLAFGLALAGTCWLRGHFVEIQYPHVQPVHCLYAWPAALGVLAWGGEVAGNLLFGVLTASLVDGYRAWRVARPAMRTPAVTLGVALLIAAGSAWYAATRPGGATRPVDATTREGNGDTVRLLLIEPRMRPEDFQDRLRWATCMRERVVEPTMAGAGVAAQDPPDLVVWPEAIAAHRVTGSSASPVVERVPGFALAPGTRLLQGASLDADDGTYMAIALLVDAAGNYVGHHEKQKIVPGGEHAPFLDYLPQRMSAWVRRTFQDAMGVPLPEIAAGSPRPPLHTAAGVPFGAMICFDNAFPEVAQGLAAAGARFLVVISNENWYRGGAELHQMVAMTVCRAVETGLPIVRCTVDGATVVVRPDGSVRGLRYPPEDYGSGAQLPVQIRLVGHRTVAWPRPWILGIVFVSLLGGLAPRRGSWGRIGHRPPSGASSGP